MLKTLTLAIAVTVAVPVSADTSDICNRYIEIAQAKHRSAAEIRRLFHMHDSCMDMLKVDTQEKMRSHCITRYMEKPEMHLDTHCSFYLR